MTTAILALLVVAVALLIALLLRVSGRGAESALLQQQLRDAGFTVRAGVSDMPTAFVAEWGRGKPVIGILAEFDALPGLSQDTVPFRKALTEGGSGHGCGHNTMAASGVGAAIGLAAIADELPGEIVFLGTPAEERGSGKQFMIDDGLFEGPGAMFAKIEVRPVADELTRFLDDNSGVVYGTSDDTFHFKDGEVRSMKTRWSATVQKEGDLWKLVDVHFSANVLDNPLLSTAKSYAVKLAVGGLFAGLVIGVLLMALLRRRRS